VGTVNRPTPRRRSATDGPAGAPTPAEIAAAAALLTRQSVMSTDPPTSYRYRPEDFDPDNPKWRYALQTVRLIRAVPRVPRR
jgi:hypothetical protein